MTRIIRPSALLAVLIALAVASPLASAHGVEADHGNFTIEHDDTDGDCDDVYLVARHLDTDSGHYTLWAQREGSAPAEKLDEGEFNATPEAEGDGFALRLGPFEVPETGDAEAFDLALTWDDGEAHELHFAFDGRCDDEEPVECGSEGVTAVALDDGSIRLEWTQESERTELHRDGMHVTTVFGQGYQDSDTEAGETYEYELRFITDNEDVGRACVAVTAVPFFGAPLLGVLAIVGAVGAYAFARRR